MIIYIKQKDISEILRSREAILSVGSFVQIITE